MNHRLFCGVAVAQLFFAGLFALLFGVNTFPSCVINGIFLAGFFFALIGVCIHAVNNDWFAYFHAFFSNPASAKPANEMISAESSPQKRQSGVSRPAVKA